MKKISGSKVFVLFIVSVWMLVMAGCTAEESGGNTAPNSEVENKNGSSADEQEENKSVTLLYTFKATSLDPHNGSIPLRAGITETLVKLDENLHIEGWLATDWKMLDELTWEFALRDGVTFHDGTPLTAEAAKASFERGLNASESLARSLKIDSMSAEGQLLTIKTTEPYPALLSELLNPSASIVNVEAEQRMGTEAFNSAPVGTGPFKVKSFAPEIEINLERFDEYWAGKPKLKEAKFAFNEDPNVRALALQSGDADIVYNLPAESMDVIQKNEKLTIESVASLRVHFILYNQRKAQMQDHKVRKAINHLLDRQSVAEDIMLGHGTVANGPFNSNLPFGSQEAAVKHDVAQAVALLEEAGYQAGADGKLMKNGQPLTVEMITYRGRPELPLMAQLLQSEAAKAGITMNITTVENVDSYLVENSEWDIATYSNLSAPRGDGGFFLNSAYLQGGSLNAGHIHLPELEKMIHQLNATAEMDERIEITKQAVDLINQEVPHSFAVYPNIIVGMNKRVVGWKPGAEEYYLLTYQLDVE